MTDEQFQQIVRLLTEIRDLLQAQPPNAQTKITVVGTGRNPVGRPPKTKGLNTDEDFAL
jgi:hypothetical protein